MVILLREFNTQPKKNGGIKVGDLARWWRQSMDLSHQTHSENYIFWDGKSNSGSFVSSGAYILKVINGRSVNTKKIIYIK